MQERVPYTAGIHTRENFVYWDELIDYKHLYAGKR